jgi:type IV fimbrial biogenesis protein FimT
MHKHKHKARQSGFSLIELMTAVVIGGIVMAVGLPMFSGFIKNSRLTTQTNDVLTSLHVARNEAVNRGHNIRILTLSGDTDWASGWQIRLDVDDDGTTDAEDTVLRNYDAIKNATLVGDVNSVTFEPTGYLDQDFNANPVAITLTASECTAEDIRIINVQLSGLVGFTKQACP